MAFMRDIYQNAATVLVLNARLDKIPADAGPEERLLGILASK